MDRQSDGWSNGLAAILTDSWLDGCVNGRGEMKWQDRQMVEQMDWWKEKIDGWKN